VIDDFGIHRESDWVNQTLYDLIDSRYEKSLITILTSNEPMESWKGLFGGRLYSRLRQICIEIHLDGADYRLRESRSIS
ncbi:MAG: ATP-binding protein, partial [Leptospiraceae bacterium]|nr:ATP-binding protein [Leptospiraceae bacterium]